MMVLGGQTITITTDPVRDRHGDPVGEGTTRQVHKCRVQPLASQEMWEGPEGAITVAAMLFAPPDADLQPRQHIHSNVGEFRVVGKPQLVPDLHGTPHHYEVRLREVRGPIKDPGAG